MQNREFTEFWSLYPRKVAKRDAEKAWKRLSDSERQKAITAIPKHSAKWEDPAFIPYAATWLNGARWEDEIEESAPKLKLVEMAWWASHEGVEKKARELGMYARAGESWADFKARVIERERERAAA